MPDTSPIEPIRPGLSDATKGVLFGLAAVLIWGSSMAYARAGMTQGLTGMDFALFRYGTAGVVVLPWLLLHQPATLAGVGWPRATALALLAGPLFILLGAGGYAFAPLAHGAVIQPAFAMMGTTLLAAWVLKDRPPRQRLIGISVMVLGLAVIAGPGLFQGGSQAPIGDAMFAVAGLMWAGFTVTTNRWRVKALPATAALSAVAALAIIPIFLLTQDVSRIAAMPWSGLATQVLVQGVLTGVVAVIFFTRAAELAGAARAGIFPALVPAATILIGIPVTGEWPTVSQLVGLGLVSLGLVAAVAVFRRRRPT
ncbi:DMT family transporter [Hydrogenophaga sp. PAMC20947]|uniref:DMT family transporter n=1 Tax=Hydrogenophaga sp. PAMC20947 TaxID=2565558 RepID=UPI001448626B|nr:DMT family transporter [Hydrogenophaga sp. PAMC20947]